MTTHDIAPPTYVPLVTLVVAVLHAIVPAPLAADPSDLCLRAAQDAARINAVPLSVLIAITQTETGRGQDGLVRPWPWTVNIAGQGYWFEDLEAALAFTSEQFDHGARSFDVGCFQVNYRWHGENFISIEQMFDPLANATYAAGFLASLHDETGDWSEAAGAYHSRTVEFANRYRARFDEFRAAAIAGGADSGAGTALLLAADIGSEPANIEGLPRRNSFVFLQPGGASGALGSLVPLAAGG